jgi:hypothetical protein
MTKMAAFRLQQHSVVAKHLAFCSHLRQRVPGLDAELQLAAIDSAAQRCRQTLLWSDEKVHNFPGNPEHLTTVCKHWSLASIACEAEHSVGLAPYHKQSH